MNRHQRAQWVRTPNKAVPPSEAEKRQIIEACETFIRDVLKPRFLPEIRVTRWNYVVEIHGAWTGGRYRFIQRYRAGHGDNEGEEFDAPFARLDRMGPDRFDIKWMRHTGRWWPLYEGKTLKQALRIIDEDELLHPV
jgi:hypothetical protein